MSDLNITHKQRFYNTNVDFDGRSACGAGSAGEAPRASAPYLTITNKCTNTPVNFELENDVFNESKNLFLEFSVNSVMNPEYLSYQFKKGFLRCKFLNDKLFSVYYPPNLKGNSSCSLGLNDGHLSNSMNNAFQSANRLRELIQSNPEFKYFAPLLIEQ